MAKATNQPEQRPDPHSDETLRITLEGDWQQFCALLTAVQLMRTGTFLSSANPTWQGPEGEISRSVQLMRMHHFADQLIVAGIDTMLDDLPDAE